MTPSRSPRSLGRTALLLGAAVTATVAFALPLQRSTSAMPVEPARAAVDAANRVLVHLTSLGLLDVPLADGRVSGAVLVFTTGDARVGLGTDEPVRLTDTLRLGSLPAMTADVTDGEVHIQLVGPGSIKVGGDVTGGPALRVGGTGRHLIVLQGGRGIRSAP